MFHGQPTNYTVDYPNISDICPAYAHSLSLPVVYTNCFPLTNSFRFNCRISRQVLHTIALSISLYLFCTSFAWIPLTSRFILNVCAMIFDTLMDDVRVFNSTIYYY